MLLAYRVSLTRLRTSCHKLHIERGRYTRPKTDIENRICSHCDGNCIEDEEHFINKCTRYNELRHNFFESVFTSDHIRTLDPQNKFIWLFSNEDDYVCKKLATYVNNCFKLREG